MLAAQRHAMILAAVRARCTGLSCGRLGSLFSGMTPAAWCCFAAYELGAALAG